MADATERIALARRPEHRQRPTVGADHQLRGSVSHGLPDQVRTIVAGSLGIVLDADLVGRDVHAVARVARDGLESA